VGPPRLKLQIRQYVTDLVAFCFYSGEGLTRLSNGCLASTDTDCFVLVYIIINSTLVWMRESITQEFYYGCGIACFAFALEITYKQAANHLGELQANSTRFLIKDFTAALNNTGKHYIAKYMKPPMMRKIYKEGTIVLIRRSKQYPAGHYLIRHKGHWMDPWINLPLDNDITQAKSGFRKRLPGKPMYALLPQSLS
jgi:hypothetical protein